MGLLVKIIGKMVLLLIRLLWTTFVWFALQVLVAVIRGLAWMVGLALLGLTGLWTGPRNAAGRLTFFLMRLAMIHGWPVGYHRGLAALVEMTAWGVMILSWLALAAIIVAMLFIMGHLLR